MGYSLSSDKGPLPRRTFSVPHPPVKLALFLTLEAAFVEAWRWLHAEPWPAFNPHTAKEVDYTAQLHIILQDHLLGSEVVEGFTEDVFTLIDRIETVNFDGTKKSKRPDLIARLPLAHRKNVQPTQDGIFIECKPVDAEHSLVTDYCDKGISRFIVGDYAWAMTEALMVGYNTGHPTPSAALVEPFKRRAKVVQSVGVIDDCPLSPHRPPAAISRHKRTFPIGKRGRLAPPIQLRHLWLP